MPSIEQKGLLIVKVRKMSDWNVMELILTAESPIHIGDRRMGVIELTKRYIPGKNFWGIFTAIITKELIRLFDKKYKASYYSSVGLCINDKFKFSYFYPYDKKKDTTFIPIFRGDGLEYLVLSGSEYHFISEYEFDHNYIDSYTSAALDYKSRTAKDHYLHETEYIKPGISFRGYIFYRNKPNFRLFDDKTNNINMTVVDIEQHIESWVNKIGLQGVGGKRTRGFGRVSVQIKEREIDNNNLFGDLSDIIIDENTGLKLQNWSITKEDDIKIIQTSSNKAINLALMPITVGKDTIDLKDIKDFNGDINPIVGRVWANKLKEKWGAGQSFSNSKIAISPGSTYRIDEDVNLTLVEDGIVELV